MTERILDKIDRLGAEAGIQVMTTEIRRFALLIRADMLKTMPMPTGMDGLEDMSKMSKRPLKEKP